MHEKVPEEAPPPLPRLSEFFRAGALDKYSGKRTPPPSWPSKLVPYAVYPGISKPYDSAALNQIDLSKQALKNLPKTNH